MYTLTWFTARISSGLRTSVVQAWSIADQRCGAQTAAQPEGMRVRFKVVESDTADLRPQDCNREKALREGSLPAVQASFPDSDCFFWHDDCWKAIDEDVIARLVVDGSRLMVVRKPGE